MTYVGHSVFGATISLVTKGNRTSARPSVAVLVLFAVLANVPDFPLPYWGHERYDISHSLFVNLGLMLVVGAPLVSFAGPRRRVGGVLIGGMAWLSHLLLDSFYNHGEGIAIFWPVSTARLALPIPWFSTLREPLPHVDPHSVRVWSIELAAYGTIFVVALLARRALLCHRN